MGEYTTFVCRECGYTADRIRWGVSVNDPRQRFMPADCVECKAIAEVDLTGADIHVDEFHCVVCGSQLFFLEKAASYTCPKCKANDMELHPGRVLVRPSGARDAARAVPADAPSRRRRAAYLTMTTGLPVGTRRSPRARRRCACARSRG